jgi:hypothetical protein
MKLNIRATGILNGLLFISMIGEFLWRSSFRSKNRKGGALALIAIILYVIGFIGVFFGSAIKAALNRQREYLADASAVQFTRLPKGLANALKKIGGSSSLISAPNASEFSHFYFSEGVKNFFSFDTHPPLDSRIKVIEPYWNGRYIVPIPVNKTISDKETEKEKTKEKTLITTAAILGKLGDIGDVTSQQINIAEKKMQDIPKLICDAISNPLEAQFVIFSMLLDKDKNAQIYNSQLAIIKKCFEQSPNISSVMTRFQEISEELQKMSRDNYLNVINLIIPTLKMLSKNQYVSFKKAANELIEADKKILWFELNLKYLVLYPLDIAFELKKIPNETHTHIGALKNEVEAFLSVISYAQFHDDQKAKNAFEQCVKTLSWTALKYVDFENISINMLENAYNEMQKTKLPIRKRLVEAALICLKSNDKFSVSDMETIHALCALLHLPLPIDL